MPVSLKSQTLPLLVVAAVLGSGQFVSRADAPQTPDRADAVPQPDAFARDVVPFLKKHCFACHAGDERKGDVSFTPFADQAAPSEDEAVQKNRKLWEKALELIRGGEMPPEDRPRPEPAEIDAATKAIEQALARFDCTGPQPVGRVTLRRLNRNEYDNTIRDLVGVEFRPAADFPQDDVGYGFDNIGDVLSVSPLLLERYLHAAEMILEQAIVAVEPPKPEKSPLGGLRASRSAGGEKRDLGFYLYGPGAVSAQRYFEGGDYHFRVEATAKQLGDEPVRAAFKIDDAEIKPFEIPLDAKEPNIVEVTARVEAGSRRIAVEFLNPYRAPAPNDPDAEKSPATDETEAKPERPKTPEEERADRRRRFRGPPPREPDDRDRLLVVKSISLDGPYDPPPPVVPESHKRIMAPGEGREPREAAREIATRFATRAFRRPVEAAEIEGCLKLFDQAIAAEEPFENAVRLALTRVLVSPYFLFRVELDPPGAKPGQDYPLNEYELASRLSYFLWSSMPDDELFALAAAGQLRAQLEPQFERMLKDEKSAAFVRNFAGQWLTTRKLEEVSPDPQTFPEFDDELRAAMIRETELFFEAIVREDRSILDLLDADFSFVNERLARHYGIEGVKGQEFERVKLPANRGGVLTQASILTLTSNATRTSPVGRGKWVLDQLLNTPPPPPPPDVPQLDEAKQLTGSLRQRMEQHRANAICASCHARMDPIGFAFENYDAIGRWRDKDGEFAIDPSGELPDGQAFQGPAELKAILKGKKDLFRRALAEKILTYALGRGLEYYDRCAIDKILAALDKNGDKFSTLLVETINSEPFQMRTATGDQP
ncbi:MAG TPA: DUF1592 domain-containing protein [Pirellulales bacterium]|nr:DUF1592 domain-containing protein [Pirellulales bacterium]